MYLKEKRIGIGSKLLNQSFLQSCQWFGRLLRRVLLEGWVDLLRCKKEILPEGQTKDVEVLSAISKCGKHVGKYFPIFEIVWVYQHNAICRKRMEKLLLIINNIINN